MERRTFLSTLGAAGVTAATGFQYTVHARGMNATTAEKVKKVFHKTIRHS